MDYKNFKEILKECNISNREFSDNILKGKNSRTVNNYIGKEVPTHYEALALFLKAFKELKISYQDILNGDFFQNIEKYKSQSIETQNPTGFSEDEILKLKEFAKSLK